MSFRNVSIYYFVIFSYLLYNKINYALEQIGLIRDGVSRIASSTCRKQSESVNNVYFYGIANNGEVTTYSGNNNKAYVIPFCKM